MAEPGLRERKKAATRQELRDRAAELFRRDGYEATTVAHIAEAAGVSEPTFFRYYGSKAEVALAPLAEGIEAVIDAVVDRPASEQPLAACTAVAHLARDAGLVPPASSLTDLEVIRTTPELGPVVLRIFDDATERLADDFARRLGLAASDPVTRQTASAVMGTMLAVFRSWMEDPSGVDPATLAADGFARLRHGLR
jgi:AcrR family transcriptional regulator